jgi:citrate synthase
MANFTTDRWETSIAEVRDDDVLIRGELLTSLIADWGFVEVGYLVLTGRRPTPGQVRVLEGLMVSIIEHGISPSTTVARMMASYGVPIQVGIAAGQLTVGDYHGGANQQAAIRLQEVVASIEATGEARVQAIHEAAASFVREHREAREPIEGFGHPQHGADPRVPVLLGLAKKHGVYGDHCLLLERIEVELAAAVGKPLPANIDGASAALLLDLGLDPRLARPLLMAPRVLSLGTHFVEEMDQGGKWRHVPNSQVTYTGPAQNG